jgi:trehalose-6-phosphate synthase
MCYLVLCSCRDGLNRLPIEYTLARSVARRRDSRITFNQDHSRSGDGVIILSEFVSSARVMRGALLINPWKFHEVTNPPT